MSAGRNILREEEKSRSSGDGPASDSSNRRETALLTVDLTVYPGPILCSQPQSLSPQRLHLGRIRCLHWALCTVSGSPPPSCSPRTLYTTQGRRITLRASSPRTQNVGSPTYTGFIRYRGRCKRSGRRRPLER